MGKEKTYTLNINIPIKNKKIFGDWQISCINEFNDGRWQKIISDHNKVKEIASKLDEMKDKLNKANAKLDLLMETI